MAQQTADHGLIVGVVNGSVSVDSQHHRFWGVKALVVLGLVGLVLGLAGGLDEGVGAGTSLLSVLVVPLLLLVCFGLIFSILLGIGAGRYFAGLRRGAAGAARAATRGMSAGAQGGMGALRSVPAFEHTVPVRRFRVQSITGQILACVLVGELVGDEVRHGDVVRFMTRSTRHGHYEPRRIDVLSSPAGPIISTVTVRPSLRFLVTLWGDRVAKVLAAIIALGIVVSVWQALM